MITLTWPALAPLAWLPDLGCLCYPSLPGRKQDLLFEPIQIIYDDWALRGGNSKWDQGSAL